MTGFPSCRGTEDPRKKSVPALVPTSGTEGDGELRCFVSETYLLKKQVATQHISKAQIEKNEAKTMQSACCRKGLLQPLF